MLLHTRAAKSARGAVPGCFPDRTSVASGNGGAAALGTRCARTAGPPGDRSPGPLPAATIARVRAGLSELLAGR